MGRRTLLLITSILIAAVGTALIGLYVKGADTRATDKRALQTVLVAKIKIEMGTKLDNSNTEVQEWPKDNLPVDYYPDGSTIANQKATTTIYPQTPIQKGMIGSAAPGTAAGIKTGQMGITVELSDPLRAAGLLKVNSTVEIFFVPNTPSSGGKRNAVPILGDKGTGITVIELGNDRLGSTSTATTGEGAASSTEDVPSTLVGLALTGDQVKTLRSFEAIGTLSFAVLPAQGS